MDFCVGDAIIMTADEFNSDTIDGWITGNIIWKEGYFVKIKCDDDLILEDDIDNLKSWRGLRKLDLL